MSWIDHLITTLADRPVGGYLQGGPAAAEPTALAALALLEHERGEAALPALHWLAENQQAAGQLGTAPEPDSPGWPTALALLAWLADDRARGRQRQQSPWREPVRRALQWTLDTHGEPLPRTEQLGHDTTLIGWPWVQGTHSWVEPTSLFVVALKSAGMSDHPRTREAVRLLLDRQLPGGGCNLGNTVVLGNPQRAHAQPTGLALLALAGETSRDPRIGRSVAWLRGAISSQTAAVSLCWSLLGLAAHGSLPPQADPWLAAAAGRLRAPDQAVYKQSLLLLAASPRSDRIALPQESTP